MKTLTFRGAKLAYDIEGKGFPVVLLHGFCADSRLWEDFKQDLLEEHYRVVTIDLPGFGGSEVIPGVSIATYAEAVLAVLVEKKLSEVIVIGHSMGGYVSLALAEKKPEMIKGLCLLNSTANSDNTSRKKLRLRANKMAQLNLSNVVRMSFINLFSEKSKCDYKAEIQNALNDALKTPLQGYIACQEGMRIRPNRMTVLKNSSFKKMFILGKKDPVLSLKKGIEEAQETQSETVVLLGGHMSHIENTNNLKAAIRAFIKLC